MSNDDCEEILVDEYRGIALVELPGLTKYAQLYQLELHDFQNVCYVKEYMNSCLVIEFSDSQLNLICDAWLEYRNKRQPKEHSESDEK